MKISIGILAYNEERFIESTVASLMRQTVFADAETEKEIILVANGCIDRTAAVADAALKAALGAPNLRAEVLELAEPGKANAWNVFIHEASAKDTDYFVLLDADIEFERDDAISRLIQHLEEKPEIEIAPDQPVKKFRSKGFFAVLIRAMQKTGSDGDTALSGQLYAARAKTLRSIVLPRGLVVEDGFLRAMTLTGSFTHPEERARICRAPAVRHFYAPYESLSGVYRYERRQAAGTAINRLVYREIQRWRKDGLDPAAEIARRNEQDPGWLEGVIAKGVAEGDAIPRNYVFRRLRRRDNWSLKRLHKLPLIAAATLFDLVVAIDATKELRNRSAGVRWDTIRETA